MLAQCYLNQAGMQATRQFILNQDTVQNLRGATQKKQENGQSSSALSTGYGWNYVIARLIR